MINAKKNFVKLPVKDYTAVAWDSGLVVLPEVFL
jgi:hypothetical protein